MEADPRIRQLRERRSARGSPLGAGVREAWRDVMQERAMGEKLQRTCGRRLLAGRATRTPRRWLGFD